MVDPDKADKADRATSYESTLFANSTIFIFGALRISSELSSKSTFHFICWARLFKLTRSLVNVWLKFQMLISEFANIFC